MTTDDFTDAARAEAEALVDDIILWDDTIATDGPCDGTWDSLAAYLAGRGWARTHLAAQADAWDEGFQDGRRYDGEGDDGPRYINPYSGNDTDR